MAAFKARVRARRDFSQPECARKVHLWFRAEKRAYSFYSPLPKPVSLNPSSNFSNELNNYLYDFLVLLCARLIFISSQDNGKTDFSDASASFCDITHHAATGKFRARADARTMSSFFCVFARPSEAAAAVTLEALQQAVS